MDSRVDRAAVAAKREHVAEQLAALRRGDKISKRVGGATITSYAANVAVQQARLDHLDWLLSATDDEVQEKLEQQTTELGGIEAVDGAVSREMSVETLLKKGLAELTQLALGEHQSQKAQRARNAPPEEGK